MPALFSRAVEWAPLDRPFGVWLGSAGVLLLVLLVLRLVRVILRRRSPSADEPTLRGLVGRLNDRWMWPTSLVLAAAPAALLLTGEPRVLAAVRIALVAVLTLQVLRFTPVLLDWGLLHAATPGESRREIAGTLTGLRWLILLVSYALILLLALQNAGVDVTSLVAGLGIGGIAVALAVQNILGDLFASLTIALDKPFVVGDFIVVGSEMGAVEHVGLKTTRVRSLSGEQLVFGNADLLSSRIRNYKRMSERRVVFSFGVVYATEPDQVQRINAVVRAAIESQPKVRFDRCHLHRFGDSALEFEAVYYINSPDYNEHMDAQQAIHLAIARGFKEAGVELAYPTRTLLLPKRRGRRRAS